MSLKISKRKKSRLALCGFHLCPVRLLWRGGKGGRRAKTLVLVWTFCALKFRHQPTTRRQMPPMVVQTFSRFAAFPPCWAELKNAFSAFFGTRCLSCVVVKIYWYLANILFWEKKYARRGGICCLIVVYVLLFSCIYVVNRLYSGCFNVVYVVLLL